MKIRSRLILWYFTVTLAIVLLFGIGTYLGMKRLLFQAFDDELLTVCHAVQRSYNPSSGDFELHDPDDSQYPFRDFYLVVYDIDRNRVYSTPMTRDISLGISLPTGQVRKKTGYLAQVKIGANISSLKPNEDGEVTFRAIAHQLYSENRQIGWAVVALPIEAIEESMEHLFYVLLVGILLAMLLIGTGGYFLTSRALNPIDVITKKANQVSHSNLDQRIEVRNKNDELGRLAAVLNDLLGRLHKAFESQQLFLADAAHELKTPLSVLRAHWEDEINNPKVSMEMKRKLVQDVETITRLNHMLNNLLLLAQTEVVQANLEVSPIRLDLLMQEVISDTEILAQMKSQNLVVTAMPETTIQGDKARLYQLFFNLIDNAVKYTPEGGEVKVALELNRDHVAVHVSDNGLGIPKEDLPHIFERFYRVKKDRARATGGSGLGLSIGKLISELHGGVLEVESQAGVGSVFTATFPRKI